jgi:hypothetical protein
MASRAEQAIVKTHGVQDGTIAVHQGMRVHCLAGGDPIRVAVFAGRPGAGTRKLMTIRDTPAEAIAWIDGYVEAVSVARGHLQYAQDKLSGMAR